MRRRTGGIIPSGSVYFSSVTERAARRQINVKIKAGETKSVIAVLDRPEKKLGEKFRPVFRAITADNGPEFVGR